MLLLRYMALVLIFFSSANETARTQVLPFRHYAQKDGLISNRVTTMMQDSRGFLWIGTGEGISIFDGVSFKNFTTEDGLSFNFIMSIVESKTVPGRMWIGTGRGVTRYENGVFSRFATALGGEIGRCEVLEDRSGVVWCGSGVGLFEWKDSQFVPFHGVAPENGVNSIVETADSTLWLYLRDGLYYIPPDRNQIIRFADDRFRHDSVSVIEADRSGNLWLLANTAQNLLYRIRNQKLMQSITLPAYQGTTLMYDERGTLFIGTPGSGVVQLPTSNFSAEKTIIWTKENGLLELDAHPGLIDLERNLWLYGQFSGITVLTDPSVETIPMPIRNLTINNSLAAVDSANHLWVATFDSLVEFWQTPNGTWRNKIHILATGKPRLYPASVQFDQKGNLLCKLAGYGIIHYLVSRSSMGPSSLARLRTLHIGKELPNAELLCFTVDHENNLWCSLQAIGMMKFNLNNEESRSVLINSGRGIPLESIRSIFSDNKGNMWFGDFSKGLFFLPKDSTSITRVFTTADGLPDNFIRSLYEDQEGKLWIGTRYGGISVYHDGHFQTISKKDGLLSNAIWCMSGLPDGSLAVGTDNGVQYIDPVAKALNRRQHLTGQHVSTIHPSSTGLVWLLTPNGITIYDPRKEQQKLVVPPVYITSVTVNNTAHSFERELDLEHDQDNVTITFTGINFRNPSELKYEYRLGASEDWSSSTTERTVTFAKLEPGEYIFEARAISKDGHRSDVPAALSFTIASPFWQQWWFIFGINVVVVGFVWLMYRYRTNQLLKMERLRTRIATDLHDDIGSTLSSISIFSEMAKKEVEKFSPKSSHILHRIGESSRSILESMDDIVWTINPDNDRLENITLRIREFAAEMFEAKAISFELDMPQDTDKMTLSMEMRKNIFLIVKEAVNNIVKHSRCTNASVAISIENSVLSLSVQDNGVGLPAEIDSSGNGLTNMRRRADEIGGTLTISSLDGADTLLTLRVRIT